MKISKKVSNKLFDDLLTEILIDFIANQNGGMDGIARFVGELKEAFIEEGWKEKK
jgi:hypothetical protein